MGASWASASSGAVSTNANAFAAASASADICNPSSGRLWISCASALTETMEKSMDLDGNIDVLEIEEIQEIDRETAWGRDGKLNKAQKNPD